LETKLRRFFEEAVDAMPAPHYMPFYTRDFLDDPDVLALDIDSRGFYLLLLAVEWEANGRGVEVDSKATRTRLGIGSRSFRARLDRVRHLFEESDGRLFNPRLEEELKRVTTKSQALSKAGKRGGKAKPGLSKGTTKPGLSISESESDTDTDVRTSSSIAEHSSLKDKDSDLVYFHLQSHPWNFGHLKTMALLDRGMTVDRLALWDAYAKEYSRPLAAKLMQRHATPADVPVDPAARRIKSFKEAEDDRRDANSKRFRELRDRAAKRETEERVNARHA